MSDPESGSRHETSSGVAPVSICPVCERPLAGGGSVLFQGDQLVHAICWRAGPPEAGRPAA